RGKGAPRPCPAATRAATTNPATPPPPSASCARNQTRSSTPPLSKPERRPWSAVSGKVFADRYYAHALESPRETAHAVAYVLGNFARHAEKRGEKVARTWIDPYSSAAQRTSAAHPSSAARAIAETPPPAGA